METMRMVVTGLLLWVTTVVAVESGRTQVVPESVTASQSYWSKTGAEEAAAFITEQHKGGLMQMEDMLAACNSENNMLLYQLSFELSKYNVTVSDEHQALRLLQDSDYLAQQIRSAVNYITPQQLLQNVRYKANGYCQELRDYQSSGYTLPYRSSILPH